MKRIDLRTAAGGNDPWIEQAPNGDWVSSGQKLYERGWYRRKKEIAYITVQAGTKRKAQQILYAALMSLPTIEGTGDVRDVPDFPSVDFADSLPLDAPIETKRLVMMVLAAKTEMLIGTSSSPKQVIAATEIRIASGLEPTELAEAAGIVSWIESFLRAEQLRAWCNE